MFCSTSVPVKPSATTIAPSGLAVPNPSMATPLIVALFACTCRPIASPPASRISTSGAATWDSARPSTPTVPPVPNAPVLVSPTLSVCVVPSIVVPVSVIAGSAVVGEISATPAVSIRNSL